MSKQDSFLIKLIVAAWFVIMSIVTWRIAPAFAIATASTAIVAAILGIVRLDWVAKQWRDLDNDE